MQKIKIGHRANFRAKYKCFPQILFPVRAILRSINFRCTDFNTDSADACILVMACVKCARVHLKTLSSLLNSENVAHAATTVNLTKEPTQIKTIKLTEAIDCEQFNDATKLFRVTALSLKFIRNLKAARNQRREPQNTKPTLTVEEISEAKSLWIREIQEPIKHENNFENLKQQLGLYSGEDDILRCKGRLGNAHVTLFCYQDDTT